MLCVLLEAMTRQMERVKRYRKAYRNWISVMWAVYRNRPRIELKLRSGLQLKSSSQGAYQLSMLLYI